MFNFFQKDSILDVFNIFKELITIIPRRYDFIIKQVEEGIVAVFFIEDD